MSCQTLRLGSWCHCWKSASATRPSLVQCSWTPTDSLLGGTLPSTPRVSTIHGGTPTAPPGQEAASARTANIGPSTTHWSRSPIRLWRSLLKASVLSGASALEPGLFRRQNRLLGCYTARNQEAPSGEAPASRDIHTFNILTQAAPFHWLQLPRRPLGYNSTSTQPWRTWQTTKPGLGMIGYWEVNALVGAHLPALHGFAHANPARSVGRADLFCLAPTKTAFGTEVNFLVHMLRHNLTIKAVPGLRSIRLPKVVAAPPNRWRSVPDGALGK